MACGETGQSEICTPDKADDVCVARHGGNGGFLESHTAKCETVDALNDQLSSLFVVAVDAVPGVIGAVSIRAVI